MHFEALTFLGNWMATVYSFKEEGHQEKGSILIWAILDYVYFGKEPKFEDMDLFRAWVNIHPVLGAQQKKIAVATAARINGKKGGRPRKRPLQEQQTIKEP